MALSRPLKRTFVNSMKAETSQPQLRTHASSDRFLLLLCMFIYD